MGRPYKWIVVGGGFLGLLIGSPPPLTYFCVSLWILAACGALAAFAKDRVSRSAVSPVLILFGLAVVYGVVMPIRLTSQRQTYLRGINYEPWLMAASAMCAAAALSFSCGYLLAGRNRPNVAPSHNVQLPAIAGRLERIAWALTGITAALFVYVLYSYGVGGYAQIGNDVRAGSAYITYAPQYLTGAGLFLYYRSSKLAVRRLGLLCCFLTGSYFYLTGVRYLVVTTVGATVLLIYWRRKRGSLPPLRYLFIAIALGVIVLGLIGQLRSRAYGVDLSARQAAESSFEIVLPLAGTVRLVEQDGFLAGSSYSYLLIQVVPRSLWPNKPFPPTYEALAKFTVIEEGRAFPVWGEMFLNFGWPGVVAGMGAFGYLTRVWISYWLRHRAVRPSLDVTTAISAALLVQWVSRGLFVQLVYNTMGFVLIPLVLILCERRSAGSLRAPRDLQTAYLSGV